MMTKLKSLLKKGFFQHIRDSVMENLTHDHCSVLFLQLHSLLSAATNFDILKDGFLISVFIDVVFLEYPIRAFDIPAESCLLDEIISCIPAEADDMAIPSLKLIWMLLNTYYFPVWRALVIHELRNWEGGANETNGIHLASKCVSFLSTG